MWGPFLAWIRQFFGRHAEEDQVYTCFQDLLGNAVLFKDIRDKMMGPEYTNPNIPIPYRLKPVDMIVLHCTADDDKPAADIFALAKYDISPECHINPGRGCPTVTYHYYIEFVSGNCIVYHCLDHAVKAWHVGKWNSAALGVAIDYDGVSALPALKWDAAAKTVAWILHEFGLPASAAVFHRELKGTGWKLGPNGEKIYRKQCPGKRLDPWEFRRKVSGYLDRL